MAKRTKTKRKQKPRKQAVSRRRSQQPVVDVRDWLPTAELLRPVLTLGFLLLLAVAAVRGYSWMMRPDTLPVKHVTVSGEFRYLAPEQLRQVLAERVRGGFFSLDLEQLRKELEALPWVYRVALRRGWPDRLHVAFEEQVPIARWGESAYLNRYGEVFAPPADGVQPQGLPQIVGEPGREKTLIEDFIRYDRVLRETGLMLVKLEEDARQDQHLELGNGMQLVLGRDARDARLMRFARIFSRTLASVAPQIAALDLRYSNGFSVRWNEPEPLSPKRGKKGHV